MPFNISAECWTLHGARCQGSLQKAQRHFHVSHIAEETIRVQDPTEREVQVEHQALIWRPGKLVCMRTNQMDKIA